MENHIILRKDNTCSAFGALASRVLLHHRRRIDDIHASWIKQEQVNRVFNQSGLNQWFVIDPVDGNVLAASRTLQGVLPYATGAVLLEREIA